MAKNNKKYLVLESLWQYCREKNDFVFHNDLVKEICKELDFGNPFDVTKLDSKDKLPLSFLEQDICLLHLGKGRHRFVHGVDMLYHTFEPMQDSIEWEYRKSLLNEYNDSESNILSVANNQRILHHFLFGKDLEFENIEIENRPKTYFPHRTKTTLKYELGDVLIIAENQQIEIDLTIEYKGLIGIFETKNGEPKDFNIYQIYHPYLYYHNSGLDFKQLICVYLIRNGNILKFWSYTFNEPLRLDSIKFLKSCEYILIRN